MTIHSNVDYMAAEKLSALLMDLWFNNSIEHNRALKARTDSKSEIDAVFKA